MILAVLAFTNLVTAAEVSFAVVSIIVRSGTVASILYLGVRAENFTPGVSGHDLTLAVLIFITGTWFIVSVVWSRSVWVVVKDVGMLGLIYRGTKAGTVAPGVLGCNVALAASTWRTGTWFLVAVAWSNSVWVMVMDVGMLGLMLVSVG